MRLLLSLEGRDEEGDCRLFTRIQLRLAQIDLHALHKLLQLGMTGLVFTLRLGHIGAAFFGLGFSFHFEKVEDTILIDCRK